ncbi:CalY family protein [Cytobacillus purgationiresistens]|uniref:CalY family protein n=1 Tax=Cytobacillus purgationiresistens TaxID=863449 RepID=UPI0027D8D703|nr:CalY family protein [Cytobacillus purgationiresistens]
MGIKKKLGMGVASAALGIALIGGGTFAYFSDTVTTQNTFAAGTLDLSVNPEAVINIDNIKPGDTMTREFILENNGSLKIANINLVTNYTVNDAANDNVEDFGKHIRVNFLWNWDKESEPIFETTLYELQNMDPDVVKRDLWDPLWAQKGGIEPGQSNELWVQFEFIDNGEEQNAYQGDSLSLEWIFNATQGEGENL